MAVYDTQYLVAVMQEVQTAPHGKKGEVYRRACEFMGVSPQTLHSLLGKLRATKRKRRSDAGDFCLTLDEAQIISTYLMEGYRKNDKKMIAIPTAVAALRANGLIVAAAIDEETGEMRRLSASAISRALRAYNLHPDQLRRPAPHIHLSSQHPNHVWQVDASVCTLYYLPSGAYLAETDRAIHYKNKPENLAKIESQRVIRYVLTDHCTGLTRWRYYPHSESGENTVRFIVWAALPKGKLSHDPFHGLPGILQVDPGATSAGIVARLCELAGTRLLVNKPGAPRAKGQVENAQNIVETQFEQGLRFCSRAIRSIDELNVLADTYQVWWNLTQTHTRHGMTRFEAWLRISSAQLRVIPDGVDLLGLVTSKPDTRKVQGDLTINYAGKRWKVKAVPTASVGDKLMVCANPLNGNVMVIIYGEDGREAYIQLEEQKKDDVWQFYEGPTIGENYERHEDTLLDVNRKTVAKIATGASNYDEAEKMRKRKGYDAFNGSIDPFKQAREADLPTLLPRTGTAADLPSRDVELVRKNPAQMALWLKSHLRDDYDPTIFADVSKRFPDGATEPELEQVLADLKAGRTAGGKARLRAV